MAATSPEKRCLYEVLGLQLDSTADEIRSAYRKLALQRHPDKLVKSGVSEAEATAAFQELVNAYEVLSDPKERAWYDSHRSQILFATPNSYSNSKSKSNSFAGIPDLFSFFSNSAFSGYTDTGKGFYKVYADLFDKIYQNEVNFAKLLGLGVVKEAPLMGNLKSHYDQVNAFYGYWLGFVTVMDFVWVDEYDSMAGPDRKSRRLMEDENKKLRKKARREFNEMVRNLAEFVKKRDKRVIDMQMKKNAEMEKKREEERERKKKLQREKAEKARAYVEPEWARVEEEVEVEDVIGDDEKKNELYCVVCSKKFKSDKQWKNHEQSKKHKEKVAELREALRNDGQSEEEDDSQEEEEEEVLLSDEGKNGFLAEEVEVDELKEQFEEGLGIQEEGEDDNDSQSTEEEAVVNINNGAGLKGVAKELGLEADDDEVSVLEAMLCGRKNRKTMRKPKNVHVEVELEEIDLMEYNNRKGSRRNRGGMKGRGKEADEDEEEVEISESSSKAKADGDHEEGSKMEEPSSSNPHKENENDSKGDNDQPIRVEGEVNGNDGKGDADQSKRVKGSKQVVDKKAKNKKDKPVISKIAFRGQKQKKVTSRSSGHECDTCGEDFESRNRLHKHLNDSGHASLKSR